jgi:hypothetical protein
VSVECLHGSLVTSEASIISCNNENNSTSFGRVPRHALAFIGHLQSETIEDPQLEGVGSIRRQLHIIFHFVEMGDCETLFFFPGPVLVAFPEFQDQ